MRERDDQSFQEESDDSLFEESIAPDNTTDAEQLEDEHDVNIVEEEGEYHPGDLVSLRGLFNDGEDLNDEETLEFEEIPDDIDIDEPIEVEEKLTRMGRILDVTVRASLIFFGMIVIGFIINAILFAGAVLSTKIEQRVFVDVSKLDQKVANIDVTVLTESQNFGRFIRAELEKDKPIEVKVYLTNDPHDLAPENFLANVYYEMPKDKRIEYNGGKRNIIDLKGMNLKLNPSFDSSRLSGFMEPRKDDQLHERYPRKVILHVKACIVILSFWIPFPFLMNDFQFQVDMDSPIDPVSEEKKAEKMKAFDFNPKFVHFEPVGDNSINLKVRQPVPKFYAPPFFEMAVHVPEMNLQVRQFTMKDPFAKTDIVELFESSNSLAKVKVKPFRMIMTDEDLSPNILDIEATISKRDLTGLTNVLKAFRDSETLPFLAFLFASDKFNPLQEVKPQKEVTFVEFMDRFWGRQAYPVDKEADVNSPKKAELPGVPELYDPSEDPAMRVTFKGVSKPKEEAASPCLSLSASANTHFVISEYKLPILMISGQLPPVKFKMVTRKGRKSIARFKISHVNNSPAAEDNPSRPLGKEIQFDIQIYIDDLEFFTKFGLKALRMLEAGKMKTLNEADKEKNHFKMKDLIGSMFEEVRTVDIVADYDRLSSDNWISVVASVFDMRVNLTGERIEFIYIGNERDVIGKSEPINIVYSIAEEEKIKKSLVELLGIDLNQVNEKFRHQSSLSETRIFDDFVLEKVKEIKKQVLKEETELYKASISKLNFAEEAMEESEKKVNESDSDEEEIDTETLLKYINVPETSLDAHRKLAQVRSLMNQRIILRKAIPAEQPVRELGVFTKIDSKTTSMTSMVSLGLPANEKVYDDQILIKWQEFSLDIADEENVRIASINFDPRGFNYSLTSGQMYRSKLLDLKFDLVLESSGSKLTNYLQAVKDFYQNYMDTSRYFLPCNFIFKSTSSKSSDDLILPMKAVLPTPSIPAVGSCIPKEAPTTELPEPGFFDNLTKSYFDFIGYGFSRLIFNAILPNPTECPAGSSIINVEINLPPTTSFVFGNSEGLGESKCIAAINTARPLRLWTQIIDGVLCNIYSVADGLEEQEVKIQGRISKQNSKEIIESFSSVLGLRNQYKFESNHSVNKYENVVENFNARNPTNSKVQMDLVPIEDRIALVTTIPVNVEIIDFDQLMKILDNFSDKKLTTFTIDDPTIQTGLRGQDEPTLINSLIGVVASNAPIQFNTEEQKAKSLKDQKRISFSEEKKMVLKIDTHSPNPNELTVNAHLFMARVDDFESVEKEEAIRLKETENGKKPYIIHETLSPEMRYRHPIIRWGKTVLRFAFPKFMVELKLSAGDIKITNDGAKILFDSLKNFKIDLGIKARSLKTKADPETKRRALKHLKEIFKTTSIRQIFKRCHDFVNRKLDSTAEPDEVIETTSSVSFGPKASQNFHFFGSANMNSFFLLQSVLIRKMFSGPPRPADYNPKEDPTFIDFSMLISLAGDQRDNKNGIPNFNMPCFFTNFCSAEQLNYSEFNKKELMKNGPIPVTLHIRNTFQPLTASIASGFATLLPLFHMETYPGILEWNLNIPEDQVVGMEMNGQLMFYGKAGPLTILRSAEIPYPNAIELTSKKSGKAGLPAPTRDILQEVAANTSGFESLIEAADVERFDNEFFETQLNEEFADEVQIQVMAQIPPTLPEVLRKMLLPMFSIPIQSFTLHPPIVDIKSNGKFTELAHAPIAVAMSDTVVYKEIVNGREVVIKPSLLTKLFAAFIEETSSGGMEMHKLKLEPQEPDLITRMHYSQSYDVNPFGDGNFYSVVAWFQFPWAMGPIGFDYGEEVSFQVYLPGVTGKSEIVANGKMVKAHMSGKVARMRLEVQVPKSIKKMTSAIAFAHKNLDTIRKFLPSGIVNLLVSSYTSVSGLLGQWSNEDIPAHFDIQVDNNFRVSTEAAVPRTLFSPAEVPKNASKYKDVELRASTGSKIEELLEIYREKLPQAVACVYTADDLEEALPIHNTLWTELDLSMSRLYYPEKLTGIKPNDSVQLFLQLRTWSQLAVCGKRKSLKGLAVMFEYIRPREPVEILFNDSVSYADPPRKYCETLYDPQTSVYLIVEQGKQSVSFEYSGRYRIYVALQKTGDKDLKALRYTEIKFAEIYVQTTQ